MSLFSRHRNEPEDPQDVVDRVTAQSGGVPAGYSGPVTAGGQPGVAPPLGSAGPGEVFQMIVEDVFVIQGRGVVATGRISAGRVARGMRVVVYRAMQPVGGLTVTGVEMFRKQLDTAAAGDNVGLLLSATDRSAVRPGDLLADR